MAYAEANGGLKIISDGKSLTFTTPDGTTISVGEYVVKGFSTQMNREFLDVTSLDHGGSYREYMESFRKPSTFTLEIEPLGLINVDAEPIITPQTIRKLTVLEILEIANARIIERGQ